MAVFLLSFTFHILGVNITYYNIPISIKCLTDIKQMVVIGLRDFPKII